MTLFTFLSLALSIVLLVYCMEFIIRRKRMKFRIHLLRKGGSTGKTTFFLIGLLFRRFYGKWLLHLVPAIILLFLALSCETISAWQATILFLLSYVTFAIRDFVLIYAATMQTLEKRYKAGKLKLIRLKDNADN